MTPLLAAAQVAVFGLCPKLALLVGYVVQVIRQMAVPDFADARRAGDRPAMRRILRRAVTLPAAALADLAVVVAGAAGAVLASYAAWIFGTAATLRRLGEMRTGLIALLSGRRMVPAGA
ncbi:hypothetical protein [Methylobacterium nodulans]|uniref:Uncharacterized protein n=1 Tax=Methylobacterium nodulans (strain LMG 21967 / CNCM I-2342 / ORS 2060) TaxID=460265 RepID=B8IL70_METNO|nr:hypothetical protein [Methylobacterium nodulans]ACL58258.1 hypothetical protein Mnod_3335 [Methylobacterium nodulans ORS 2060]